MRGASLGPEAWRPFEDTVHAAHALVTYPIEGEGDPPRQLRLGPTRAGNLLELVVLHLDDGRELVIYSMPTRLRYRQFLTGGDE